jgi:hypothetical protein
MVMKARLWPGLTSERQERYATAEHQLEMAPLIRAAKLGSVMHLEILASRPHLVSSAYKRKSFLRLLRSSKFLVEVKEQVAGPEKAKANKIRCVVAPCLGRGVRLMVSGYELIPNDMSESGLI